MEVTTHRFSDHERQLLEETASNTGRIDDKSIGNIIQSDQNRLGE